MQRSSLFKKITASVMTALMVLTPIVPYAANVTAASPEPAAPVSMNSHTVKVDIPDKLGGGSYEFINHDNNQFAEGEKVNLLVIPSQQNEQKQMQVSVVDSKNKNIEFNLAPLKDYSPNISFTMGNHDISVKVRYTSAGSKKTAKKLPTVKAKADSNAYAACIDTSKPGGHGSGKLSGISYTDVGLGTKGSTGEFIVRVNTNNGPVDVHTVCYNPSKYGPNVGTTYSNGGAANEATRRILYYGTSIDQNGNFIIYDDSYWAVYSYLGGGTWTDQQRYVVTHAALSKAEGSRDWASGLNKTGRKLVNDFVNSTNNMKAPPSSFKAYLLLSSDGTQNMVYTEGPKSVNVLIIKRASAIGYDIAAGSNTPDHDANLGDQNYDTAMQNKEKYSLTGSEISLYKTETDAQNNQNAIQTVALNTVISSNNPKDNNAALGTFTGLDENTTYWYRETKAPTSGAYKLNPKVYSLNTNENNKFLGLFFANIADEPLTDPVRTLLYKRDKDNYNRPYQGDADMTGAEYTLKFWFNGSNTSSHPDITFIFRTDADGILRTDTDHLVNGGDKDSNGYGIKYYFANYYGGSDNKLTLPLGSYTLQETKAPEGYNLDNAVFGGAITNNNGTAANTNNIPVMQLNDGTQATVQTEEVKKHTLIASKIDKDIKKANGNGVDVSGIAEGNATLEGAVITVYNTSKQPIYYNGKEVAVNDAVGTITLDKNGKGQLTGLPYGTYMVKETTAPEGYMLNANWSQTVTLHQDSKADAVEDPVQRGGLTVIKLDKERLTYDNKNSKTEQGDASFEGAQFTIYNISKQSSVNKNGTIVPTAGENNVDATALSQNPWQYAMQTITVGKNKVAATGDHDLPYGTYVIRETVAPTGYLLDNNWYALVTISSDGQVTHLVQFDQNNAEHGDPEQVMRGGLSVQKVDQDRLRVQHDNAKEVQGDAHWKDAEFTIYNISNQTVINRNGKPIATAKTSSSNGVDATKISNKDASKYAVMTIKTDESGKATTGEKDLPYGTYVVRETKAPEGYLLNNDWYTIVSIRSNGDFHDLTQIDQGEPEPVMQGGLSVIKLDKERLNLKEEHDNAREVEGDARWQDAEFTIYNVSNTSVVNKDDKVIDTAGRDAYDKTALSAHPEKYAVQTITTDSNGLAQTGDHDLPYGTYVVRETKAPTGYLLDNSWYEVVQIRSDGDFHQLIAFDQDTKEHGEPEQVIRGGVTLEKWEDSYEDDSDLTKGLKLDGINFMITNVSDHSVLVDTDGDGKLEVYKPNQDIMEITTQFVKDNHDGTFTKADIDNLPEGATAKDYKYIATTDSDLDGVDRTLPYGTYTLTELPTHDEEDYKTVVNNFFTKQSDRVKTFRIHWSEADDGKVQTKDLSGDTIHWDTQNKPIRGDLSFEKTLVNKNGNGKRLKYAAFLLTNESSGEKHIIMTDKNGQYSSAYDADAKEGAEGIEHSHHTNANDVLLDQIKINEDGSIEQEEPIDTEKLAGERKLFVQAGTYFNAGWFGNDSKVRDDWKALPKGAYRLQELSTVENQGYELIDDTFEIGSDMYRPYKDVDMGTLDDQPAPKRIIRTTAKDKETLDNVGTVTENSTIVDTVEMSGLEKGHNYTLATRLMDKSTGAQIEGAEATTTFTSKGSTTKKPETVDVEITFDSTKVKGKDVVVFEKLYDGKDTSGDTIANHEDLTDEGQTVTYNDLHTTAKADETGTKTLAEGKTQTITDEVKYENLVVGKEYTVKGTLMDKKTNEAVKDADGKEITAETTFTPEERNGSVNLVYTVDSSLLAGTDTVVFEDLIHNDKVVGSHADIEDEDQTVHTPKIGTTASDLQTKDDVGVVSKETTLVDKVAYTNLAKGEEYSIHGVLMNKTTGEALKDADGKEIAADITFTAEDSDGEIELEFKFDSSLLEGTSVVAFETASQNGITVATHADINDEGQTVNYPSIHTTAVGEAGTKTIKSDKKATVTDTVTYTNLVPGKKYTMHGTLMNKETGKALEGEDGKAITADQEFTPDSADGSVDIKFTFDSSLLEGKDIVAFEDLIHNGVTVTSHADINDEGQTTDVPSLHTTASDSVTKTHQGTVAEKAEITDTVAYTNLVPGVTYKVSGTLMDKETGKALEINGKPVTAEKEFTPEKADGTVDVVFTFDSSALAGKTLVAFETASVQGVDVITHADINDADQTVKYPSIGTEAKFDDGSKEKEQASSMTVVDTVAYKNLVEGEEYTIKGTLMDKKTGEAVKTADGKEVTGEAKFKADKSDGEAQITFNFDGTNLESAVAFEEMYDARGNLIGVHKDINDEKQTVTFTKPPLVTVNQKKTGEAAQALAIAALISGSALAATSVLSRKKKKTID